jgi:hypothetical protein
VFGTWYSLWVQNPVWLRDNGCGVTSNGCGVTSNGCGVKSNGCGVTSDGCGVTSNGCDVTSDDCGVTQDGKVRSLGELMKGFCRDQFTWGFNERPLQGPVFLGS